MGLIFSDSSKLKLKQLFLIILGMYIYIYSFPWSFAAAGASGKDRPFIEPSGKPGNASVKSGDRQHRNRGLTSQFDFSCDVTYHQDMVF